MEEYSILLEYPVGTEALTPAVINVQATDIVDAARQAESLAASNAKVRCVVLMTLSITGAKL